MNCTESRDLICTYNSGISSASSTHKAKVENTLHAKTLAGLGGT